jgi:Flp pilus assembly pilin Flp
MKRHFVRRGAAAMQWLIVAIAITVVVIAGITVFGSRTNDKLNQTAEDVVDPKALTQRFGS